MMIFEILAAVASGVTALKSLKDLNEQERKRRDAALKAISEACTETAIYVQHYERTRHRDENKEHQLVRLWNSASIPVRHFNRDLADRCFRKAEYWLNPTSWPREEIERLRIELDRVTLEAKDLKTIDQDRYLRERRGTRPAVGGVPSARPHGKHRRPASPDQD